MAQCKVFVGSLPPGTKPKELRHLFQNFGIVVECDVMNRCGFVHMENPAMAETAILALHGSEFKGQPIIVEPGRPKDGQKAIRGPPMANAICADGEGPMQNFSNDGNPNAMRNRGGGGFGNSRRGMFMGNRGGGMPNRGGGMGNQFGMSNRGGGGGSFNHRGGGMGGRGGPGGNPFANRGGEMGNNMNESGGGGFGRRGGGNNTPRGGGGNQNDGGPMRNNSNFKSRSGPYPQMDNGDQHGFGGGRFGGNQQRSGFGGPNRSNSRFNGNNLPQLENNFEDNNQVGPTIIDFVNINADHGNGNGMGNFRGRGQGRGGRGFSNAMQHQGNNPFENNRPPMEPQNSFRGNDNRANGSGIQPRFNSNMRGGQNQRGRGGSGRGSFNRNQGEFNAAGGPGNNFNNEFPALSAVRGRGGFGGNRGGMYGNATHMMPNQR